jgi:hypothetical protein
VCSGLSVVLTLWGQNAVGLEAAVGQVLQATCLRVSDYNGCSLTTVSRSIVTLDPESPGGSPGEGVRVTLDELAGRRAWAHVW